MNDDQKNKMSKYPRRLSYRLLTLLASVPLLLSLTQCAASPPPALGTEHCGAVSCTGTTQCAANLPLCAQASSATCLPNAPRECAWKLAISSSCPCMEHDVRLCVTGSTPGVEICTANSGRTGTYWAACIPCPGCPT